MPDTPAVEFRNITKLFPGVLALNDVSLSIARGSCHGLMGENGAGKSTLGKVLAGIYAPDSGQILVDGKVVHIGNPRDALEEGIGIVHQELAFCENLTVAENLHLGNMPAVGPFVLKKRMIAEALKKLEEIGATIDVTRRLGELPISQQQMIQIASAISANVRILIFDEPTSSLSQAESERLLDLIRRLKASGVTSIFVSHRLPEIFDICDTVSVLRDGQHVSTLPTSELDEQKLISMMIGRPYEAYFPSHLDREPGPELLRVENLRSPGKFESISFTLRAGEIIGFAGLVGAGRTEVAEAIFGLDTAATGNVYMNGGRVDVVGNVSKAVDLSLGLVPEDRKRHGLILLMSAKTNITLPILKRMASFGWVNRNSEEKVAEKYFDLMRVRASSINVSAASLSGGNQQKLVLSKWLASQCRVLLVDEPTRGVDVGAKAEIHSLINDLAANGSGIMLISSELPEVLNLSTRVIVMRNGRIAGELSRAECTQESLMRLMAGVGEG